MDKENINNRENQVKIMEETIQLVNGGEMTREKLIEMQDMPVAPEWTVGALIGASIYLGKLKWKKDVIVSKQ